MQRAILLFKTTDVNVLSAYVVISGWRNSPERFSLKNVIIRFITHAFEKNLFYRSKKG
ncbi:hypothetical protein GCM10020331_079110 [Ectobacillus funiculus]